MSAASALHTPSLLLEPFAERHLTLRYVAWLNDPEAVRHSEQRHRRHTLESCRAYAASFDIGPSRLWALLTREGRHVGNVSAAVDKANGLAELGILIGERDCWGRGLATEAWTAVADHLLRGCGLRKLVAGAMAENAALLRVAEKLGMEPDGRRTRHFLLQGREVDCVYFRLFRQDWLERHPEPPFQPQGQG